MIHGVAASRRLTASDAVARHLFIVLVGAFILVCMGWQQVHAHATLIGSHPLDGARLEQSPSTISLHFNEPVSLLSALLIDPKGERTPLTQAAPAGEVVELDLPPSLGTGSYAVSWRVVSDDGHPIAATTFFVIGKEGGVAPNVQTTGEIPVAVSLWAARLLLFTSLFFGVGGAAFRLLAGDIPVQAEAFSRFALLIGLAAALLVVGLQGLDLLGLELVGLIEAKVWIAGFSSPYGSTALVSVCAIVCALTALAVRNSRIVSLSSLFGLALLGLSVCLSGHASVAEPRWLSRIALFAHAASIAWWIGALLPLALLLRLERRRVAPPLIRFSRYIPYAIAPLVLSGMILAFVEIGFPGPSWLSAYGAIFAAKMVLVGSLFVVASWNRWVLTAPAAAGKPRAMAQMRRGIVAEIILFMLILGLVAGWRFTPPPRALVAQAPSSSVQMFLRDPTLAVSVTVHDVRTGATDISLKIALMDETAPEPRSVKITMRPPDMALAPVVREAKSLGSGLWRAERVPLLFPGLWELHVDVRITDFDLVKVKGMVEIKPR